MKQFNTSPLFFLAGACWLALGTFALISPSVTYLVVVKYAGVALLLDGLLLLILAYIGNSSKKEKGWRLAEAIVDMTFSSILLLDPVFSFFIFPFIVSPWMATKGLLKVIAFLSLGKNVHGWSGDFIAGILLVTFSVLVQHDPIGKPYGISLLVGVTGLTLGLLYVYDYLRSPGRHHTSF